MTDRKTLWMRFVDFENTKKMLHLIYENDGKLRSGELERLGIDRGVLVRKDNREPMTHTPRYHYRKVMENLGLAEIKQRHYYVSRSEKVMEFLKLTNFQEPMSNEAKEILRKIILENNDCRNYFFDVFMRENSYTLEDLRKGGDHILVETKSMRDFSEERWKAQEENKKNIRKRKKIGTIILRNPDGREIELKTQDEIHAIYWGVRLWALELGMTDEIMTSFIEGRIIYPINPDFSREVLLGKIQEKIKMDKSDSEWILIHIPTFIKEIALSYRFSVNEIKNFFLEMKTRYSSSVMFIPSSTVFLDIRTPFEKQDSAIRNLYLHSERKGYISHMRIRKNSLKKVSA